ncbi:hypothetical protein [Priestia megaterium]|uniref:hypothetical protein n=1 Tax=Priestia megaterium TaxID=1404 RepID=UPI00203FA411|nr:hypothetical protein [Priestia megaterium]MCM3187041.1 hypothetical protein [Priestia megaterium]
MSLYLDGRTSQNASILNSIAIPTTSSYVLWGVVGLDVGAANPLLGPIRVQFDGTITFGLSPGAINPINTLEIKVVRGNDPNVPSIYTLTKSLTTINAGIPEVFTFTGSDYNPPQESGFLIYSVFIRNITGASESDVIRRGPESFNASAIGN